MSRSTLSLVWLVLHAGAWSAVTGPLPAQSLPSESTLPGQRPVTRQLPPESALPGGMARPVRVAERIPGRAVVQPSEPEASRVPAPEVAKKPAPEAAKKPAPVVAKKPAPVVAKKPAPDVAKKPAPEVAKKPAPEVVKQSAPDEGKKPAAVVANKSEPPVVSPPESEVPSPLNQRTRELPNESELPSSLKLQPPVATTRIVDGEPLVTIGGHPPEDDDEKLALLQAQQIGRQPSGQPWLRLNMDGHTGTVRALGFTRDSSRLVSGGDDKSLEVWSPLQAGKGPPRWINERTIRWQVQRGPRGRIHAVAVGPNAIAIAGHGAMGGLGEILLVDPASGELRRALVDAKNGHHQTVLSLSFAPSGTLLASQDITGRAVLWRQDAGTGLWSPRELSPSDTQRYKAETARLLIPVRNAAPIAMIGERYVVYPVFEAHVKPAGRTEGVPTWRLERVNLTSMQRERLNGGTHAGTVAALAASPDGTRMASADTFGNLFFWNMTGTPRATELKQDFATIALSFAGNGRTLAVGGGVSSKRGGNAALQLWDVSDMAGPRRLAESNIAASAYSVALSPNAQTLAYAQDDEIVVKGVAAMKSAGQRLQGRARPVLRVAFSQDRTGYRVAFGTRQQPNAAVALERSFDLSSVRNESLPQLRDADWISPSAARGEWSLRAVPAAAGETYWLYYGQKQVSRLPLRQELHGRPTSTCWIAGNDGRTFAVAVGTSLQGNIYVFRLASAAEAPLLRQFRGHDSGVRSIGMSRDRRYLVSGGDDATIRIWNLAGFDTDTAATNRWGAEFEVRNGELAVASIRTDGPLYFRGVRADDVIRSLQWVEAGELRKAVQPAAMLALLRSASPDTQVVFDYRRRDSDQPLFQMLPAWQQLVALFVAENREWAFWTPAGYYDASFDGHKLFGWQVNRGVYLLPEFFLAAQFQQALERPQVMEQLLSVGSLEAAFQAIQQPPPGNAQNAVLDQYRLKPRVEIVSPRPDESIADARTTIQASITVRDGLQLTPPKAFANGVVATGRRLLGERAVPGGREFQYAWDAALPSDSRVIIQVVASTDARAVDAQSVVIRRPAMARQPARLYVVAAGVNDYRDAQIQSLDYAASNARSVVAALRNQARGLYHSEATMLLDSQVTRPMWTVVSRAYAERLREEAQPDDLLLFFLSGHGVRDEETSRYYFVASNARFDDVKAQRFADCLSFEDFAAFAEVPCRKLVVLDTCHSGAVQQPLRQQDLKAALRALQSDVVFTLTASEGSQEASEEKGRQLGRFTARLLEALSGSADQAVAGGDADGVVTLNEAFRYVSSALAADSAGDENVQHPTAGPIDLLEYAIVPLAGG